MSNRQSPIESYPLLPFAQFIYDTTRWIPSLCYYKVSLRTRAFSLEQALDVAYKVMSAHPVFQSRINWQGRQYAGDNRAQLQGPYHRVKLWQKDGWLYVNIGFNIVLGDGYSIHVLRNNLFQALQGETLEKDDYWGYIERVEEQKRLPHYANSKSWLENEFANPSVPVRPTIDRRCLHTVLLPKVGVYTEEYSTAQAKINQFLFANHLTLDGFFSLCTALAIAEYCGTDEAALTWAYEGRERPEEQRIFGNLHRDVPFKISRKSKVESQQQASREELIREARSQIRSGIAHSDYPYTLTAPYNRRWNYAVNVLRVPDIQMLVEQFPIPVELISIPTQKYAYAILDVEIHESENSLALWYRYSATHYKPESIQKFAVLVRKYVEWMLTD